MSIRSKSKGKRPGRGALLAIGALFFASGVIRMADGTGDAIAKEIEALASQDHHFDAAADPSSPSSMQLAECATEDGLASALASLRERASQLDEREKQVEYKMTTVQRAEEELQRNLASLIEAEEALSATIARADGAAEQDISRLIAVYEKMKPKEAAAVFEAMDTSFAAGFLARLRPDAAASVMAGLSPNKAYSVSVLLAGRNAGVPTE